MASTFPTTTVINIKKSHPRAGPIPSPATKIQNNLQLHQPQRSIVIVIQPDLPEENRLVFDSTLVKSRQVSVNSPTTKTTTFEKVANCGNFITKTFFFLRLVSLRDSLFWTLALGVSILLFVTFSIGNKENPGCSEWSMRWNRGPVLGSRQLKIL